MLKTSLQLQLRQAEKIEAMDDCDGFKLTNGICGPLDLKLITNSRALYETFFEKI